MITISGQSAVSISTFSETGRGLKALQNFKQGETILSAPNEALWTKQHALREPHLGEILKQYQKELSTDDILAIYLMFVKLSPQYQEQEPNSSATSPPSNTQKMNNSDRCTYLNRKSHILNGIPESYQASVFWDDNDLDIAEGSSFIL
jgi:hypothetical protein